MNINFHLNNAIFTGSGSWVDGGGIGCWLVDGKKIRKLNVPNNVRFLMCQTRYLITKQEI